MRATLYSQRALGRNGVRPFSASRKASVAVRAEKVLIVNTKGGGHAFIGLYLAKELVGKGHTVTIMNDGDEAKLSKKAPFSAYSSVPGLTTVYADPADPATYPSTDYDVVYDNNGKDMASCGPLIDAFKGKGLKHYVYVSSAGAYKANSIEPMHVEGDVRKASAGHVEVEGYLAASGLPFTVFQPLYIYGPNTAKDCEQWFVDRIIRDRPVPIPTPGVQLVTLSHVEDVASMLAAVPGNKAAIGQHYNICSDRAITLQGIAKAVGKALGKEANVVTYPVTGSKAEGFPFRIVHFFASSDKAKRELGWKPAHNFLDDVADLVADYQAQGRQNKEIDFSIDDKILASL